MGMYKLSRRTLCVELEEEEGEEVSAFFSTNSPNQILALGLINLAADPGEPWASAALKTDQASV